ncbi:hypothetical protein [Motilibacter peucedani]|uniref:hypothetical protein n=1 Tax=Motilibacter peucedani TaxID=598650 RepID=UPI00160097CD|nr:hypothetical protein [Motilibacter peucedani]
MDSRLVDLNVRVALLADAWLDSGDDAVLVRLEAAVAARRDYLQPALQLLL